MADVQFIAPKSTYDPTAELDIKRRRKMADAMMKAGEQPQSTEMVSGMAVKQSPFAALARALTQGVAGYQEGQADQQDATIQTNRQKMMADAIGQVGTNPNGAAAMLAQDPNTAPQGMQIALEMMKDKKALELAQFKADHGGEGGDSAHIKDFNFRKGLGGDEQAIFDSYVRAQQKLDLGDRTIMVNPVGGGNVTQGFEKGVSPDAQPDLKGRQQKAVKNVDLDMNPQIEAATETAKNNAATTIADNKTLPIIEQISALNKDTFDIPYAGKVQGVARMIPGTDKQTTALDLMLQSRIEAAAPLAKQLGVNPTDKDFQASLDRIFNTDSTKSARQAEIDNLATRIRTRQAGRGQQLPDQTPAGGQKIIKYDAQGNKIQ